MLFIKYFVFAGAALLALLLWVSSTMTPVQPLIPTSQVVGLPEAYRGTMHPSFDFAPADLGPQSTPASATAAAAAPAAAAHAEAVPEHRIMRRHRETHEAAEPRATPWQERRDTAAPFAREPVP